MLGRSPSAQIFQMITLVRHHETRSDSLPASFTLPTPSPSDGAPLQNLRAKTMLIKQSDYHRIYRVINSLLINENANPAVACMYFATFGAFILGQHYRIKATPKGGLAAYNLGGTLVLFADHREDGYVTGAGENFHCWVEAEGWAIDFMAPAFRESARELSVPSKMFQRPLSSMAPDINSLAQSGDFFYQSEAEASARRFADWHRLAMIGDLATVAANWFRKSPRQMPGSISVANQSGTLKSVPLAGNSLVGAW